MMIDAYEALKCFKNCNVRVYETYRYGEYELIATKDKEGACENYMDILKSALLGYHVDSEEGIYILDADTVVMHVTSKRESL